MYNSPYIRYDGTREEREWFESRKLHPALFCVVLAAALWLFRRTKKFTVITHILRTRAEQLEFYPDQPDKRSPHEFGRAVDIRTRDLDIEVVREWADWINRTFKYLGKAGSVTALVHDVGHGHHLHIQIGPQELWLEAPETFIAA